MYSPDEKKSSGSCALTGYNVLLGYEGNRGGEYLKDIPFLWLNFTQWTNHLKNTFEKVV